MLTNTYRLDYTFEEISLAMRIQEGGLISNWLTFGDVAYEFLKATDFREHLANLVNF